MSTDLTITSTHREVMRRLDRGESLTTELAESLGDLYLHALVDDVAVEGQPFRMPALTSLGRRVLDVGGVLTTRQERPRLVSRPMPTPWEGSHESGYTHPLGGQFGENEMVYGTSGLGAEVTSAIVMGLDRAEVRTMARDLIALIDWLDHEDAVRAQDGGS